MQPFNLFTSSKYQLRLVRYLTNNSHFYNYANKRQKVQKCAAPDDSLGHLELKKC